MKTVRLRSLQAKLALRLAALYVAATVIAVAALIYEAYETADTLNDRELSLRAADLARYVAVDSTGAARLELPVELAARYQASGNTDIFAIRRASDAAVAASPPNFGEVAAKWPAGTDDPSYFHLKDLGWMIPLLVISTLVVGAVAIRSAFKPVAEVSQMAASIGPGTTSIRLPETNLPSEITPLVTAVNRALDRLEQGFHVQRQFTANAAHELRTPLAIVTAALDVVEGNGEITKIKADVARMNRLVDQLLRVARLDAVALDVSDAVDLNDVASEIVAAMAPWALAKKKPIAFHGEDKPVVIKGNRYAIGDAIRNLVENAVAHTAPGSEVTVSTYANGSVSIVDRGPGIPPEERNHVFERFWRGKGTSSSGAGLGLAIVAEIMRAHQGSISVDDNPGGGMVFTLRFSRAMSLRNKK